MKLTDIETTKPEETVNVIIYGTDGIGKSTVAKDALNPVFLDVEIGGNGLEGIARCPVPAEWSWSYVNEFVDALLIDKHAFQTLVIDTIDWLESLAWSELVRLKPIVVSGKSPISIKTIDDYPFFTGYNMALDVWRPFLAKLERLRRERKMSIVSLAHGALRMVENPEGENYEQWDIACNKHLAGMLRQWSDAVLFASYEVAVGKDNKFARGKGIGDGTRVLRTRELPAFRAKNRYSLPFELPLSWDALWDAARGSGRITCEQVIQRIAVTYVDTPLAAKASAGTIKFKKDLAKLLSLENYLKLELSKLQPTETEVAP
jgi:hypothetical protein